MAESLECSILSRKKYISRSSYNSLSKHRHCYMLSFFSLRTEMTNVLSFLLSDSDSSEIFPTGAWIHLTIHLTDTGLEAYRVQEVEEEF